MVEISKHMFYNTCIGLPCSTFVHPWTDSCIKANLWLLVNTIKGSYQYYAMVYVIQILMRGKLSKRNIKPLFKQYLVSGVVGFFVGPTSYVFNCISRNMFLNKFYYYCLLFPNVLNGMIIYLEPPDRRGLIVNLFINLLIEYWLKTLQEKGYLTINKSSLTFFFMIGSSLLFYLMRLEGDKPKKTPLIWMFTANKVRVKSDAQSNNEKHLKPCSHSESCFRYISIGTLKLFGIGAAASLAKHLIPRLKTPIHAISTITLKHFKLAAFFGTYIGIYRGILCLICRKFGKDDAMFALPAGFLAGTSILFNPSLTLSIASVTAAAKLYCTTLYDKNVIPHNWPIAELLYCICQGILFHAYFMHSHICPKHIENLINTVSNGLCRETRKKLIAVATQGRV